MAHLRYFEARRAGGMLLSTDAARKLPPAGWVRATTSGGVGGLKRSSDAVARR